MSLDEGLAAFSASLVSGEETSAADQRDLLSILAENLRDSQDQLRESQDQLRESQGQFRDRQNQLRESDGQLRESQGQFRVSQDQLRKSQDELRENQGQYRDSQDQLRDSQNQLRESQDHTQAMIKEIEHLHRALESRDIIGQAKGILIERYDVDAAEAFELLVKLSQTSNTALTVIAEKVVEIGHPDVKPRD